MNDELANSIIGGLATIIVGIIAAVAGREGYRRSKRKRRRDVDPEEREAVERYASDPGQFVKDVLESNRQLTIRVEAAEEKATRLEKAFEAFREKDRKFRNALARWFVDIMAAFAANDIDMPYPRDGDRDILSDVIPSALEATQPRRPFRPATD